MGSKTGAKVNGAPTVRTPAKKVIDRGMRKLLAKNERKRKNREARQAKVVVEQQRTE